MSRAFASEQSGATFWKNSELVDARKSKARVGVRERRSFEVRLVRLLSGGILRLLGGVG